MEWNLLYHPTSPEIAKAMRAHVPIRGMSYSQAVAVFGQPDEHSDDGREIRYVWRERQEVPITSGGALETYENVLAAAAGGKPETRVVRTVYITFIGDKAVAFEAAPVKH